MRFLATKRTFQLVITLNVSQIHFTLDSSFKGKALFVLYSHLN
jgi:hypothetical protein